jgi:predicted transcriptional regulator YdeE
MKKVTIETFHIIGISVRTTNESNQAAKDIGELWNIFVSENILDKIHNKIDDTVYAIYTDYESDYTKPYTMLLGCKVESVETIPEGMVVKTVKKGVYAQFIAKGDLTKGIVFEEWQKIWKANLNRRYTTDFEVYTTNAQDPANATVPIFIAINT